MAVLKHWWVALAAFGVGVGVVPALGQAPRPAQAHRAIATSVRAAQSAFDRGLLMLYAFNTGEARAAFRAAEAADPRATLAYFGEAVAETIDINLPATSEGERRADIALERGERAAGPGSISDDRALLAAAELRYEKKPSQTVRFAHYFAALQRYAETHPDDGMALTLAAYAGWNATGMLTHGAGDALTGDAQTILDDLDAALKVDPDDVGAHHLRIHFWEQAHRPERALADADYLAALAYDGGESHLEHMAGHIYDRLGDYARMVRVNQAACSNDDAYFAHGDGPGRAAMHAYHQHDVDFVLYGLTTLGRAAEATAFAARATTYDREIVALRLHDNRRVLELLGDAITPMRAIAEARFGSLEQARKDLAGLGGANEIDLDIARAVVARAAHDAAGAVSAYRQALRTTDAELGDPKERWWTPVGEGLGAALLEAGAPADAERVFRAELLRYPNDPRLEFGLAQALVAQSKDGTEMRAAAAAGWKGAQPLTLADLG